MPFTGHVNPIGALATELVDRGHDVRVYSGEAFRAAVESTGARLVAWYHAPDFDESDLTATFPRLRARRGSANRSTSKTSSSTPLPRRCRICGTSGQGTVGCDRRHDFSIGAALYTEQNGGPLATISITPLNLSGTQGPPAGLGLWPGTNPFTKARDPPPERLRGSSPIAHEGDREIREIYRPPAARADHGRGHLLTTAHRCERIRSWTSSSPTGPLPALRRRAPDASAGAHTLPRGERTRRPTGRTFTQGTQNIDPPTSSCPR